MLTDGQFFLQVTRIRGLLTIFVGFLFSGKAVVIGITRDASALTEQDVLFTRGVEFGLVASYSLH